MPTPVSTGEKMDIRRSFFTQVTDRIARFSGVPSDVAMVRQFVRETLEGSPVDLDHAVLIASELATNAIRQAPGPFTIAIRVSETDLVVEVSDTAPAGLDSPADSDAAAATSSMELVGRLAEGWHIEAGPEGKTVRARLRRL